MSEYIGKRIAITDSKKIRYSGVLSAISAETSTIDLKGVKIYNESSELLDEKDSVHFKGSEVKDLHVLDDEDISREEKQSKTVKQRRNQEVSTDDSTIYSLRCTMRINMLLPSF